MVESSKVVAYCRSQGSIVADRPYMQIFALIPETGCLCLCMGPIVEMHILDEALCRSDRDISKYKVSAQLENRLCNIPTNFLALLQIC